MLSIHMLATNPQLCGTRIYFVTFLFCVWILRNFQNLKVKIARWLSEYFKDSRTSKDSYLEGQLGERTRAQAWRSARIKSQAQVRQLLWIFLFSKGRHFDNYLLENKIVTFKETHPSMSPWTSAVVDITGGSTISQAETSSITHLRQKDTSVTWIRRRGYDWCQMGHL